MVLVGILVIFITSMKNQTKRWLIRKLSKYGQISKIFTIKYVMEKRENVKICEWTPFSADDILRTKFRTDFFLKFA